VSVATWTLRRGGSGVESSNEITGQCLLYCTRTDVTWCCCCWPEAVASSDRPLAARPAAAAAVVAAAVAAQHGEADATAAHAADQSLRPPQRLRLGRRRRRMR
jgi:hypothetical protein